MKVVYKYLSFVKLRCKGTNVVKCPYCGYEGEFKLLKTWKYRWWNVYLYECPRCGGRFRYQVDPEGKRRSFIIKTSFRVKKSQG